MNLAVSTADKHGIELVPAWLGDSVWPTLGSGDKLGSKLPLVGLGASFRAGWFLWKKKTIKYGRTLSTT